MTNTDRKTQILNATISLLAGKGLDGVTHRAVDERAGLPQGSTSYHFSKKSALLLATAEHLATLVDCDCDELQLTFADIVAKQGVEAAIDHVAQEILSATDETRELFLARIELTLAASRREDMAEVGKRLTVASRRPIEFFLKLISNGQSTVPLDTCAGIIDGITLMYATGQGPKPTVEQVATVFRSVLKP